MLPLLVEECLLCDNWWETRPTKWNTRREMPKCAACGEEIPENRAGIGHCALCELLIELADDDGKAEE